MAEYLGRRWSRSELLSYIGDPEQVAGAAPCVLCDGKAQGVRAIHVRSGGGLELTVLPGRGMDIAGAWFRGRALGFLSGTGITSPGYYEESGLSWLRSFYAGLLTTCGITYCGAPGVDQGKPLGLHGRLANAGAEDLAVSQEWEGEEYIIRQAARDRGVEEALSFPEPQAGYQEKVFFHEMAAGRDGRTLVALLNPQGGEGPLGVVLRFDKRQLPAFTHWKMPCQGFYVMGLEPGTVPPLNRGVLRERGELPMIAGQSRYTVQVDLEVLDTERQFQAVEAEVRSLLKR